MLGKRVYIKDIVRDWFDHLIAGLSLELPASIYQSRVYVHLLITYIPSLFFRASIQRVSGVNLQFRV